MEKCERKRESAKIRGMKLAFARSADAACNVVVYMDVIVFIII